MTDEPNQNDGPQIIRTKEGLEVRINEDGSVTFLNMPEDMIDLALELDPDAVIACDTDDDNSAT